MISPAVVGNSYVEKKCCEVFVFPNGNFSLICSFCRDKYSTFSAFDVHMQENHSTKSPTIIKRETFMNCDSDDDTKENLVALVQQTQAQTPASECLDFAGKASPKRLTESKLYEEPISKLGSRTPELQAKDDPLVEKPVHNPLEKSKQLTKESKSMKTRGDRKTKTQKPDSQALPLAESVDNEEAKKEAKDKSKIQESTAECFPLDGKFIPGESVAEEPIKIKPKPKDIGKLAKEIHQCNFCGKIFSKKRVRLDHENSHTGKNPYNCEICSKTFSASRTFYRHMNIHNGNQRKMCSECGKICCSASKLRIHTREKHLPDSDPRRFFCCSLCDGKFKTSHQLSDHKLAMHKTNNTPYTCDYCQRQFKTRKYIVQHMEIQHSPAKTAFPCSVCFREFRLKVQRDDHENTHTGRRPHQCKFCPKEFMSVVTLRRHYKTHSSDGSSNLPPIATYDCCFCPKIFRKKKARDNHLNKHGQTGTLQCSFCPKNYFTLRHFNRHVDKVHANERKIIQALSSCGIPEVTEDKQNCKAEQC